MGNSFRLSLQYAIAYVIIIQILSQRDGKYNSKEGDSMAIIKCKMCGGNMEITAEDTIFECEYCGAKQTLPKDSDGRANMFNRANHFRRQNDFDKAVATYEAILTQSPEDAEAHWGVVISRFGIEYVADPATGRRIPTCHRVQLRSILEDEDYLEALRCAPDGATREIYEQQAREIAGIQKGILSISAKEKPYDVFICYKETDEHGERTRDSALAQDIYYQLTEEGYKVFFSRITLEDKLGQQYEPYIFAALNSAKVMIVLGTKPEYFNAVWVKNEWSRYLSLMAQDRKRLLIPCYRDMDAYDLPDALSMLQSQDMSKIGFLQDLIRGVRKVLDAEKKQPAPAPAPAAAPVQAVQVANANIAALLKRGRMALEDGQWQEAREYYDRVLDMDAECAEAYWGMAQAEFQTAEAITAEMIMKKVPSPEVQKGRVCLSPDKKTLSAELNAMEVPGFLSAGELANLVPDDTVTVRLRQRAAEQYRELLLQYVQKHRTLSRAMKLAGGETKKQCDALLADLNAAADSRCKEAAARDDEINRENQESYARTVADRRREARQKHEEAQKAREKMYERVVWRMSQETLPREEMQDTLAKLQRLGDYRDCPRLLQEAKRREAELQRAEEDAALQRQQEEAARRRAEEEAERLRQQREAEIRRAEAKKRKRIIAAVVALILLAAAAVMVWTQVIMPGRHYDAGVAHMQAGRRAEAIEELTLAGSHKDARNLVAEMYYADGEKLLEEGKHWEAANAFARAVGYKDALERAYEIRRYYLKEDAVAISNDQPLGVAQDGTVEGAYNTTYQEKTNVAAISSNTWHTLLLKQDGTVEGVYDYDDNYFNRDYGQMDVGHWRNIVDVKAGYGDSYGLTSDGRLCFAGEKNPGVSSWRNVIRFDADNLSGMGRQVVAICADGTVKATSGVPSEVTAWKDIVDVAMTSRNVYGLTADGRVITTAKDNAEVGAWENVISIHNGQDDTLLGVTREGKVLLHAPGYRSGLWDAMSWTDVRTVSVYYKKAIALKNDGTVQYIKNAKDRTLEWRTVGLPTPE